MCGNPIFQYQHIVPWAQEEHFRPEDMMVLCPNHHDAATAGALSEIQQRAAKENPFNKVQGKIKGQMTLQQKTLNVRLGGNNYIRTPVLLEVNSEPIISMMLSQDGFLLLDLKLYDKAGKLVALISQNEWEARTDSTWDFRFRYQWLKLWDAKRNISLEIDATGTVMQIRANMWCKGEPLKLGPDETLLGGRMGNNVMRNSTISDCRVGVAIRV